MTTARIGDWLTNLACMWLTTIAINAIIPGAPTLAQITQEWWSWLLFGSISAALVYVDPQYKVSPPAPREWTPAGHVTAGDREMLVETRPIYGGRLEEFRVFTACGAYYGPFIRSEALGPGNVATWAARGDIEPDGVWPPPPAPGTESCHVKDPHS